MILTRFGVTLVILAEISNINSEKDKKDSTKHRTECSLFTDYGLFTLWWMYIIIAILSIIIIILVCVICVIVRRHKRFKRSIEAQFTEGQYENDYEEIRMPNNLFDKLQLNTVTLDKTSDIDLVRNPKARFSIARRAIQNQFEVIPIRIKTTI